MLNVSEKFKSYSRDKLAVAEMRIEIDSLGGTLLLDNSYIVKIDIEQSITDGNGFDIGNVVSSRMTLKIYTQGVDPNIKQGVEIRPYVRYAIEDDTTEWVQLGVYEIDDRKEYKGIWTIECFDKLAGLDKIYNSSLLFPSPAKTLLLDLMFRFGLELAPGMIDTLPDYLVTTKPEGYTAREVLSQLASLYCTNAVTNNVGKVRFVSPDTTIKDTITTSEYVGLRKINSAREITKVVANMDGDEVQFSKGTGDNEHTLFIENPLISVQKEVDDIYSKVAGFSYTPVELRQWLGFPYLECGDFVKFEVDYDLDVVTLIQTIIWTYSGGLSGKMDSPARAEYSLGSFDRQLDKVSSRISVYALAENEENVTVNDIAYPWVVLPLTTRDATDIKFTITLMGDASEDTYLYIKTHAGTAGIDKTFKTRVFAGTNVISINFLVRNIPMFSENVFLFLSTENGTFFIEHNEVQFFAYGANIIEDVFVPWQIAEDIVELYHIDTPTDIVKYKRYAPMVISVSDTVDTYLLGASDECNVNMEEV